MSAISEINVVAPKKKRATKACNPCHVSHTSCEDIRPCKRCIEKGISHLCQNPDSNQKRARKVSEDTPEPTTTPQLPVPTPPSTQTPSETTDIDLSQYSGEMKNMILNLLVSISEANTTNPADYFNHEPHERLMLQRWISAIQSKTPNEVEDAMTLYRNVTQSIAQFFRGSLKLKPIEQHNFSIDAVVKQFSTTSDHLAVPTIIWDRNGVIYYVNNAYKQLTGFPYTLPTERTETVMYSYVFNPKTFKDFIKTGLSLILEYPKNLKYNAFILTASVKLHTFPDERYVDGVMSVTLKQDPLGFPVVYIGNFLPSHPSDTTLMQIPSL